MRDFILYSALALLLLAAEIAVGRVLRVSWTSLRDMLIIGVLSFVFGALFSLILAHYLAYRWASIATIVISTVLAFVLTSSFAYLRKTNP